MGTLTVAKLKALSTPGLHGDGGTLYLHVAPRGSKSWIQRLTVNGTRRDIGLGGWPLVTLAEARDLAFENRRLARRGGDPLADKRRTKAPTFREAAANRARWRNNKTTAKDSDRYKVAKCIQAEPVFCGFGRSAHSKVISVSVLTGCRGWRSACCRCSATCQ